MKPSTPARSKFALAPAASAAAITSRGLSSFRFSDDDSSECQPNGMPAHGVLKRAEHWQAVLDETLPTRPAPAAQVTGQLKLLSDPG